MKIAVCLHIFYADFVPKFKQALENFDQDVDVFFSTCSDEIYRAAYEGFSSNKRVKSVQGRRVPNRGRNFGPLLVEFGTILLKYDLLIHLHSKKSIYSGKDNKAWSNYLLEHLLSNRSVVSSVLAQFESDQSLGVYFPVTFAGLPHWANHWLLNKSKAIKLMPDLFDEVKRDFIVFPAGGMFWARPQALVGLLNRQFSYADFESEPIRNDGTLAHVIERLISLVARKNGFKTLVFDSISREFSTSDSYIFRPIERHSEYDLLNKADSKSSISFDVFDTLIRRKYYLPDYAKYILGSESKAFASPEEFVARRNMAEADLRRRNRAAGDFDIFQIYQHFSLLFNLPADSDAMATREFEIDRDTIMPKTEMLRIAEYLHHLGKHVFLVSDSYYTSKQIFEMLDRVGLKVEVPVYISSECKFRKDNAKMWEFLLGGGVINRRSHLHIGDNVLSDIKIPCDLGIASYHVLNPIDKLDAIRMADLKPMPGEPMLGWARTKGRLVSELGANPFLAGKGI